MNKIIGDISGGLGNLLFDCAHLYTIGKQLNIPVEYHLRSSFRPSIDMINRDTQINEWKRYKYDRIFRNFDIKFDEVEPTKYISSSIFSFCKNPGYFLGLGIDHIALRNCWPSFEDLTPKEIQDLFSIDQQTKQEIEEKYGNILSLDNKVSINVRRGDYLLLQNNILNLLDKTSFYQDAISICPPDSNFIVISDGIEDCKKYFKGEKFHFIEDSTPLDDFYLQTYCYINIIPNSTFSHWAAYVNKTPDQIVIKSIHNKDFNFIKENTKVIYL